jgi:hypothetical protein
MKLDDPKEGKLSKLAEDVTFVDTVKNSFDADRQLTEIWGMLSNPSSSCIVMDCLTNFVSAFYKFSLRRAEPWAARMLENDDSRLEQFESCKLCKS